MIVGPELNYHVRKMSFLRSCNVAIHTLVLELSCSVGYAAADSVAAVQVNTVTSAMAYMSVGFDNSWNHENWARKFEVKIITMEPKSIEFELINIDPAIVNSLRRILIAEVPSVAIENVFFIDYDCIIPEEVLSHRLGLVPLSVDPEELSWKEESGDETNTVIFKVHVRCEKVGCPRCFVVFGAVRGLSEPRRTVRNRCGHLEMKSRESCVSCRALTESWLMKRSYQSVSLGCQAAASTRRRRQQRLPARSRRRWMPSLFSPTFCLPSSARASTLSSRLML